MKPFQETNYIAKDKENEQWKSSLPPEEVKEKMLAQRGFTQENGSKIQFDHTVFIQYAMTRVHAFATESSTSTILSQSVMNIWKITHTKRFSLRSLKKLPAISGNESRKTSTSPILSEKFPMQRIMECVRDFCSSKTASSIYRRKR